MSDSLIFFTKVGKIGIIMLMTCETESSSRSYTIQLITWVMPDIRFKDMTFTNDILLRLKVDQSDSIYLSIKVNTI
jgi:hypothetical protein